MTTSKVEGDELLTVDDLAALLKVRPKWVYAAVRKGVLPTVNVGRYIRFSRSDIDEWIRAGGAS